MVNRNGLTLIFRPKIRLFAKKRPLEAISFIDDEIVTKFIACLQDDVEIFILFTSSTFELSDDESKWSTCKVFMIV